MSGFVADTKDGITAFQLVTVKHALKLESKGIKMTRGPKIRKPWAIKLGLKASASYEAVIAAVDAQLTILKAKNDEPLIKEIK